MMVNYANATLFDVPALLPRSLAMRRGKTVRLGVIRRPRFAEAVGQLLLNPVECTPPTYEDGERWDGLS